MLPSSEVRRRASRIWLAARVGAWLCVLPIRLRAHTLPGLLRKMLLRKTAAVRPGRGSPGGDSREVAEIVSVVARVCRMRLFGLPGFPLPCLRRSLALYSLLTRKGYPAEIRFGVRKDEDALNGHSWVVLGGKALGESDPSGLFRTIYSHAAPPDLDSTAESDGSPALQRTNRWG